MIAWMPEVMSIRRTWWPFASSAALQPSASVPAIELRGRLPASTRFAAGFPSSLVVDHCPLGHRTASTRNGFLLNNELTDFNFSPLDGGSYETIWTDLSQR